MDAVEAGPHSTSGASRSHYECVLCSKVVASCMGETIVVAVAIVAW
jgi:hypothetical protein